jgi:PRTRC genetic system protein E
MLGRNPASRCAARTRMRGSEKEGCVENETTQSNGFFSQLLPLLADRTVVLIVSKTEEGNLSVSVIPKRFKESENGALLTPMCCTGTADELDRELPSQVGNFVAGYVRLSNNLAEIERERQEAEKTAREQARSKQGGASAKKNEAENKVEPAKPREPAAPPMLSLFDAPPAATAGTINGAADPTNALECAADVG